ncbi:murein biosynthesis integral membrane protein MurJ [Pseudomonas chengduensis]|uniref:Murein biosynthesis integral membrane protein MurJ n=1 Tax=Ectopseudomonas oleovorans TaxID=301 RepID=A0A3R8X1B7_ECTOL|nr:MULTISPECIES: lipid II flippase MurJ [Pseudomonas]MDH1213536.1 murein biosynthesis integral membrane protein MurJ [Pseudomonas chengduensis]RRW37636.1 murein biosynthesis integral membrane protein MurJ [Pseudomonas oleovorans]
MLGSTLWLTLATLLGLVAGFAREWVLVASWGVGSRSDAFIVALFLPEALRMALAAGLLSAAALPLFQQRNAEQRKAWLSSLLPRVMLVGLLLALALSIGAPLWVAVVGPGLSADAALISRESLILLAWSAPGFLMHALLCVPLQAHSRFILAGLGSLTFNLPPVIYLLIFGAESDAAGLAAACLLGSLCMPMLLLPSVWSMGWRPWKAGGEQGAGRELLSRIWPLLGSNLASQGLALLERMVASLLGEGAVTWLNLARKLINLPLVALMSLNQVLLGLMSGSHGEERLALMRRGLGCTTLLSLPAVVGLIGGASALVALMMPAEANSPDLIELVAWFSVPLLFSAWNALLARYAYAGGDTVLPLRCELSGSLLNACLLAVLPFYLGLPGIALAAFFGVVLTGLLLLQRQGLSASLPWHSQASVALFAMAAAALFLPLSGGPVVQLLSSAAAALMLMSLLAVWLKPWRA